MDDGRPTDDVYSWDLINDRVTRRNRIPYKIYGINLVAVRDKIYGVHG